MSMDRRDFLKVSTAAGGGFLLGIALPGCAGPQQRRMRDVAEASGDFRPNMYLRITPEDEIHLNVEKSEMGQGVLTSHAMLAAEELEVDVARVQARSADAGPEYRTSFGQQNTGGSLSVAESWVPVRKAAAAARQMLIAAAAARWEVPAEACAAVDGAVVHEHSGRQLRYGALAAEAARQSIPSDPPLKNPGDFEVVGTGATRVDGRAKVDGTATFGMDVDLPGMLRAFVLHPPVFGAEVTSLTAEAARSMPGVVDIFTFSRGVAIVAEKYWQARRAAKAVDVEWSDAPADDLHSEDIADVAARTARGTGKTQHAVGNVERAFIRDDLTVVEAEYTGPYLAHATMAPQNCTAHVQKDEAEAEVWAPTQSPTLAQEITARILGIARRDVTVHPTLLGGGFGRRLAPDFVAEAVMIARRVDAPVKMVWSREDDIRAGYYRPSNHNAMRAAIDKEGRPVAWRYHSVSQPLLADWDPFLSAAMPDWIPRATRQILEKSVQGLSHAGSAPELLAMEGAEPRYDIPNLRLEYTPIRTPIPVCSWRSVANSYNGFVIESFVDELAEAAGVDPLEYRRRHLGDHPRLHGVLERAAEMGDWGSPTPQNIGRGIAASTTFGTPCAQVVEAGVVDGEIRVKRVVCAVDCGVAVNPDLVVAQMEGSIIWALSAAIHQEITVEGGRVRQGNFDDYHALRLFESPRIDVHVVDSDAAPTGAGEPGVPPLAPALANAIYDATGHRLRHMPFGPALERRLAKHRTSPTEER